jgi:chromosome segregation ATPase
MPEMSFDGLSGQFEQFVERARTVLGQEITRAKNAVAAANAETATAHSALSSLQTEYKSTKDQLELVRRELQRVEGLVGVGHDIDKARNELTRVKSEAERVSKDLERLLKEKTERQAQINVLGNEAQRLVAIRTESEAFMADLRKRLGVQLGQRP